MTTKQKHKRLNQMLSLIMDSSHSMPEEVFDYCSKNVQEPGKDRFFCLIADAFLTLFSYSKLIVEGSWSQAFALLRVGIEQVAAVYYMVRNKDALSEYIELNKLKSVYYNLASKKEQDQFIKEHGIKKNKINSFFDYGWVRPFTDGNGFGIKQLLCLARIDDLYVDIENTLNAFAHGSLSVFQFLKSRNGLIDRYVIRANVICGKLYDYLCYAWYKVTGPEDFEKSELSKHFDLFRALYDSFIVKEPNNCHIKCSSQ